MAEQHDPEKLFALVRMSSADRMHFADDVRTLIQSALPEHPDIIYGIAFRAKFIVRTQNILRRLPPRDDKREQLKKTFQTELERIKDDILSLADTSENIFREKYCSPTMESFEALMNLLHDLSWIQNVKIDEEQR